MFKNFLLGAIAALSLSGCYYFQANGGWHGENWHSQSVRDMDGQYVCAKNGNRTGAFPFCKSLASLALEGYPEVTWVSGQTPAGCDLDSIKRNFITLAENYPEAYAEYRLGAHMARARSLQEYSTLPQYIGGRKFFNPEKGMRVLLGNSAKTAEFHGYWKIFCPNTNNLSSGVMPANAPAFYRRGRLVP